MPQPRPAADRDWARRLFPFLRWRSLVNRESLRADLIAGLVGAVIVLPQGVAFATLAGLPPQYGLYAAMVPTVIAALYGSSLHLVSGPTNVISIFLFASLAPLAVPGTAEYIGLALTLTFLVGVIQLGLGLAKMGVLVTFISHTVVVSFTAGAACLILAAQVRGFFGIDIPRGASFTETAQHLFRLFDTLNPYVTAVSFFTLAAALLTRRYAPRFPYMISAMIAGTLFAALLEFAFGKEVVAIPMLGALSEVLPALSMPDLSADAIRKTLPVAFAITILALTEAVSIARAVAAKTGQRIDGSQEFLGQGLSNIAGAFFSGYASSGSFNRSAANHQAGARTPLAAVFSAVLLVVVLYAVAPVAGHLPFAVMAAILFMVAWGLIDFRQIRSIMRASRRDTAVMIVTFAAAVLADLEFSIYAGVLLSLMLYLLRTSRPLLLDVKPDPAPDSYHFTADSSLPDCPQVKMVRVNGSIFFGAVDHVQKLLEHIGEGGSAQKHVVIVASGINFVDVAGAEMLASEARRRRRLGGGLYFYRLKDEAVHLLSRGGYLDEIGRENIFPVKSRVIGAIYPKLDAAVCRNCAARIFSECHIALPDGTPRQPVAAGQ